MKQVLLTAPGFLGDEVVFTGAVREIQRETGWKIRVTTQNPDLWKAHPSIAGVGPNGHADIALTNHHCPPFRGTQNTPLHFLEQYVRNLRGALGLTGNTSISQFAGELPLTSEEAGMPPPFDLKTRYWIIAAGYKTSVPAKAWPSAWYQEVVDALRGRVLFVQAGSRRDWHPPLEGVVDAVGKTSTRELVRLIYHAEGVLCPITSLMHLAAAVPVAPTVGFKTRPCVVIGGGRENAHFIRYPTHRVLDVVGQLRCCAGGGCGKSGFGPGQCPHPQVIRGEGAVPKCMTMIKPADMVAAIEFYYRGDVKLPRRLGRVEALLKRVRLAWPDAKEVRGAEVGVLCGEMSAQLLRGNLGLHLIMADRWQSVPDDPTDHRFYSRPQSYFDGKRREAEASTEFAVERRRIIAKPSVEAAEDVEDGSLDFVFIDADHGYEGCRDDIRAWFPKLKTGGLLGGHDYHRPNYPNEGVKRAVDEFAEANGFKVETDRDSTWFLSRRP